VSYEEMSEEMTRLQKICDELCMGGMVVFLGKARTGYPALLLFCGRGVGDAVVV
jgi:hypothetical protein